MCMLCFYSLYENIWALLHICLTNQLLDNPKFPNIFKYPILSVLWFGVCHTTPIMHFLLSPVFRSLTVYVLTFTSNFFLQIFGLKILLFSNSTYFPLLHIRASPSNMWGLPCIKANFILWPATPVNQINNCPYVHKCLLSVFLELLHRETNQASSPGNYSSPAW